jgi:hypothetical protein
VAELNPENIKRTNEELDKTVEKLSKASGVREKDVRTLLQQKDLLKAINSEEEERVGRTEDLYGVEESLTKDLKEQLSTTRKLKKEVRDLQRSWEDQLEEIPETFKELQGLISVTSRKVVNEFERQAAEATKAINVIQRNGGDINPISLFSEKDKKDTAKRVKEIAAEIDKIDDRVVGKGLLAKMKASKAGLSDIKEGWQDGTGKGWRVQGEMLKQKGGLLQDAGKVKMGGAMKGAGALIAGASKLVPVVSGVVAGLSKLNDMVNSADRLVKGARADYQKIAGAQFAGGEFSRLSKEYNVEIRDIARNVSLGVDHNEWNAMFSSMANAGMTLEATGSKLGYMGDVMETVRRSSLTLGMTMDITGEIFAEQSQEMRSGLQTVQEGMLEVAKGAKVAGIETNKFYQYVLQSTMAMATYGNFTGEAANAVKKMSKNAGMTQEGGAKLGADMASWTANMSHIQGVTLGSQMLNKGVNYEDFRGQMLASQKEKLKGATTEEERDRYQVNILQLEKLAGITDQASGMAQMLKIKGAEDSPEMLLETLRMLTGGQGSLLDATTKGSGLYQDYTGLGISNEMMDQMNRALLSVASKAKEPFDQMNRALAEVQGLEEGEEKQEQLGYLQDIAEILQKGSKATEEEIQKAREDLAYYGVDSEDLAGLLKTDAVAVGDRLSSAIKNIQEGKKGGLGSIDLFAEKVIGQSAKAGRGFEGEELTVEGQDKMIEALTPLEKMTQIAKDSIVYSLSDSKAMQTMVGISAAIRTGVTDILGVLTKEFFGGDPVQEHLEEMRGTTKDLKDAGALRKELTDLTDKAKTKEGVTRDEIYNIRDKYVKMVEGSSLGEETKEDITGSLMLGNWDKGSDKKALENFNKLLGGKVEKALFTKVGEETKHTNEILEGGSLRADQQTGIQQGRQELLFTKQEELSKLKEIISRGPVGSSAQQKLDVKIDSTINSNGSSTVKSKATLEGKNSREGTH